MNPINQKGLSVPTVLVFPDLQTLGNYAARRFDILAAEAVAVRRRFVVALSGGTTPQTLYSLLAQPPYAARAWWQKTHLFFCDERCVLPDDPESNYGQVQRLLLDHLTASDPQVYRVRGEWQPPDAAVDYTHQLSLVADAGYAWPRFDLVLLGMGTDGHTASLFPGSQPDPAAAVLAVQAHYQDRPACRVSLTPCVLNMSHQVFFMTTGANKAETLVKVLTGQPDLLGLPAQRINPVAGRVTWLVDEAAATHLPPEWIDRTSWNVL